MTNHPTPPPPPATPEKRVPDLREVIRQATEEILLAARNAQGKRDQLTQAAEYDRAQAREDELAVVEATRVLNEAQARLTARQARIAERDGQIRELDDQIAHLQTEGRKGTELFESYGPAAATRTDGLPEQNGGQPS